MKTVQIVIHCLPREIDQLERLCNTLRENYYFVENHVNVVLDVTLNLNDKKSETPIGVNCRTCDRMDCQQRAFPPLHKKFDIDLNKRGISVYVAD